MKRPLRIALVAHPRHPIAEPFKGGMEAHSYHLAVALMARGHDVTVFASGDSDPRFRVDPLLPIHYDQDYPWENFRADPRLYSVLDAAFGAARHRIFSGAYDVIHNNSLHRFIPQEAQRTGHPTITSLHVPPFDAIHDVIRTTLSPTHCTTVTSSQQNACWWPKGVPCHSVVVHNGIDLSLWPWEEKGGAHAIWCGRITPNKGPHHAVQAALRAGIGLRLFGYLEQEDYFQAEIAPYLNEQITYGGVLTGAALAAELRAAGLLLFTPCWDEPFGLVAIEAMACGLPVASFNRGAAKEVIGDTAGRFAPANDSTTLGDIVRETLSIDRRFPRQRVAEMFTHEQMINQYEALYERTMSAAQVTMR